MKKSTRQKKTIRQTHMRTCYGHILMYYIHILLYHFKSITNTCTVKILKLEISHFDIILYINRSSKYVKTRVTLTKPYVPCPNHILKSKVKKLKLQDNASSRKVRPGTTEGIVSYMRHRKNWAKNERDMKLWDIQ